MVFLGELKAAVDAATTDESYSDAKLRYEVGREIFKEENPELANTASFAEFFWVFAHRFRVRLVFDKAWFKCS